MTPEARRLLDALRVDLSSLGGAPGDLTCWVYGASARGRGRAYEVRDVQRLMRGERAAALVELIVDAVALGGAPHLMAALRALADQAEPAGCPRELVRAHVRDSGEFAVATLTDVEDGRLDSEDTGPRLRARIAELDRMHAHWARALATRQGQAPRRSVGTRRVG